MLLVVSHCIVNNNVTLSFLVSSLDISSSRILLMLSNSSVSSENLLLTFVISGMSTNLIFHSSIFASDVVILKQIFFLKPLLNLFNLPPDLSVSILAFTNILETNFDPDFFLDSSRPNNFITKYWSTMASYHLLGLQEDLCTA